MLVVGGLLAAALGAAWLSREEIAANLIERELDRWASMPATRSCGSDPRSR
ncbi:hypothetical protein ACFSLT_13375 [Novosphingobium resinovorum]